MATKVVMEALSPTMEEGRLVKWLKKEGDAVKTGEPIAEVETDKAVMELVARADGVLRKQILGEGSPAPVGQLVGVIGTADENIDALVAGAGAPAAGASAPAAAAKPAEQVVGKAQESAGASSVPRGPGQSQGEASMPPQQKAAAAPPQSPGAGAQPQAPNGSQGNGGRVRSSPLARRLASERGVDLGAMQGSGPGGRIIKRDIESAAASGAGQAAARAATPIRPRSDADFEDQPLTQIRKTIARRLSESIGPIPTFYLTAEIDLSRASELRDAMLETGDEFKVSFNDIVLKAVATALAQHPEVNAHWLGDKIRYHNRVHLGMAVATDDGLIVPVIFDADQKRMSEISAEAKSLAKKARERKLKPEEYTGSTFSVSNLGMFGIDQFTAIINPPEVAILAIGTVEEKPVVVGEEIEVQKRMRITMSCDHRVVDGAVGAKFLQTLRRMLENPLMLVF
jgi:pyruvate dehydrogenase E2 component (dihydrolipoyllysine-residue acetyltransferase)